MGNNLLELFPTKWLNEKTLSFGALGIWELQIEGDGLLLPLNPCRDPMNGNCICLLCSEGLVLRERAGLALSCGKGISRPLQHPALQKCVCLPGELGHWVSRSETDDRGFGPCSVDFRRKRNLKAVV